MPRTRAMLGCLRSSNGDIWLAVMFGVLSCAVALDVFFTRGWAYFYQKFAHESVMWACGLGMVRIPELPIELADFLRMWRPDFDCDQLPGQPYGSIGLFAQMQPYFTWSSAVLWRIFGLYQTSLWPMIASLAGLYGVSVFLLSRLFLTRWLAAVSSVVLIFSPAHTQMVVFVRDYSKAPFFVLAIFFLILSLRAKAARQSVVFAAAAGAAIGIGYGFRVDIAILLPIGMLVLIVKAASSGRRFGRALYPVAVFLAVFIILASPMLLRHDFGSAGGSLVMQGASENFRSDLGLTPSGYSLAWFYSDELTLSEVAAAQRFYYPNWDKTEMSHQPGYDVSGAMKHSSNYLFQWAPLFVADFATQGLKSAGWIIGFPSAIARNGVIFNEAYSNWTLPIYNTIGTGWLPYLCGLGLLILLWRRYQESRVEALAIAILLTLIMGYTGIQFAMRHFFHLEFVWIICVLTIVEFLWMLIRGHERGNTSLLSGFLGWCVAAASGVVLIWYGLGLYQSRTINSEIASLINEGGRVLDLNTYRSERDDLVVQIPVLDSVARMTVQPDDAMVPATALVGLQWDVRAQIQRMHVEIDGPSCPAENFILRTSYKHKDNVWQTFDAEMSIEWLPQEDKVAFLIPAFYRPTQYFSGLILPKSHAECEVRVIALDGASKLPLILSAQLSGTQVHGTGRFGFGRFSSDRAAASWIRKDQNVALKVRDAQRQGK